MIAKVFLLLAVLLLAAVPQTKITGGKVVGGKVGGSLPGPDSISGLKVWLKADSESYADLDPVGTATDRSGVGNNATAAGAARPIFRTSQINGLPAYYFEAAQSRVLTFGDFGAAFTAGHLFVVVKLVTDPPTVDTKTGLFTMGSLGDTTHFPYTDSTIYDNTFTTVRKTVGNPTPALTAWRVYEVRSAASDWEAKLDGTSLFSTATNTFAINTAPSLGADTAPATDNYLDGYVAEFIVYNKALSAGEQTTVKNYLAAKYNLALARIELPNNVLPFPIRQPRMVEEYALAA